MRVLRALLASIILALLLVGCDSRPPLPPPSDQGLQQNKVIYTSQNLEGHIVAAECNPGGGTNCYCTDNDVSIVPFGNYGEVTSNVQKRNTYVNAIGHKKFIETFPMGDTIALSTYKYSVEFQFPTVPAPDANQMTNPQAIHIMIQLWDGRNALFQADRTTLEAAIYYELNPWHPDYGKIKVYRNPIALIDTGIKLIPDTTWHTFELVADFENKKYVSITIDSQAKDLSTVELARVSQPTWGNEVALNITTESLASWPQANCSLIFTWTTRFRDLKFQSFK